MMDEQDEKHFDPRAHATKHLTLGRYGVINEATRINSWPELDWIEWKQFLGMTLRTDLVTPSVLQTIVEAGNKYRKMYGSFGFGGKLRLRSKLFIIIPIVIIITVIFALYYIGYLG